MSLELFVIGVILIIALVIVITLMVTYQRHSFDCYHQASPQCFSDWQCPTTTCTVADIKDGKDCAKFVKCTDAEIQSGTCKFPALVVTFTAAQTGKCKSLTDTVTGPDGRNVCKTSWPFLGQTVNTALPVFS